MDMNFAVMRTTNMSMGSDADSVGMVERVKDDDDFEPVRVENKSPSPTKKELMNRIEKPKDDQGPEPDVDDDVEVKISDAPDSAKEAK